MYIAATFCKTRDVNWFNGPVIPYAVRLWILGFNDRWDWSGNMKAKTDISMSANTTSLVVMTLPMLLFLLLTVTFSQYALDCFFDPVLRWNTTQSPAVNTGGEAAWPLCLSYRPQRPDPLAYLTILQTIPYFMSTSSLRITLSKVKALHSENIGGVLQSAFAKM